MTIHKEGYATIFATLLVLAVVCTVSYILLAAVYFYALVFVSVCFFFIVLQFFRSPKRLMDDGLLNTILSPADGKVVVVEEVYENEVLHKKMRQISVFMSPFNVHLNRFPISGKVAYYKYHPGSYLVAWHPKSSVLNERNTAVIGLSDNKHVLIRQIAGALARRIVSYVKVGHVVSKGQEMGFIKFGSRVDLFVELDCHINVKLNQKVKAGETVIASF